MKTNEIIIIGGASSIREGIGKNLKDKLKNKFVIGCNHAYNHFPDCTFFTYVDRPFYKDNKEDLSKLLLIIGQKPNIKPMSNTIILECCNNYDRTLKRGIYKANLVGIFALTLATHLLDVGTIYLLGYDYGALQTEQIDTTKHITNIERFLKKDETGKFMTHYYQGKINHRGIGKVHYYYEKGRAERDFGVYKKIKDVKIYNVSLNSNIPCFPKISYLQFFKMLNNTKYNQKILREYIKNKIIKI